MLKTWQKTMACLLTVAVACPFAACEPMPPISTPNISVEEVDENCVQLYIYNVDFNGGDAWLKRLAESFERLHASDAHWQEGKTGVQVIIRTETDIDADLSSRLKTGREEVYFTQTPAYRSLVGQGLLMDLTELVTAQTQGETLSIADKMSPAQKEYYGVPEQALPDADDTDSLSDDGPFYYAIPYRSGSFGFVYNVDMFERNDYYFAAEPTSEIDPFVKTKEERRSAGADGVFNTSDDGLPATYAEFFTLCDKIVSNGHVPLTWGGETYGEYLTWLTNALAVDCDGYEQTMMRFTMDGDVNNLGSIRNGGFSQDETPTQITDKNGCELVRSAGTYRALEFVRKLTTTERYYDGDAFKTNRLQRSAQADFMAGETLTSPASKKPIAMLADGSWWQSGWAEETTPYETARTSQAEEPSDRFAFMPLPKATKAQVGERSTLYDCLSSSILVSSRTQEWKVPLVEEFLSFITSNECLREYTKITNAFPALSVALETEDVDGLSDFAKSVMEISMNANMVAPYSTNPLFLKNEKYFSAQHYWRAAFRLASAIRHPAEAFRKNNVSVVDYFNGMIKSRSEGWSELNQ